MKKLVAQIVFLIIASFIALLALAHYPLLDNRLAMGIQLSLFILAAISLSAGIVQKLSSGSSRWSRVAFFSFCSALGTFGMLLLVNGGMDRSPAVEVTATVLQKFASLGGRGGVQYRLYVTSWRADNSQEDLNVRVAVFERSVVGKAVTIRTRSGFLGLPWYSDVFPMAMQ